MLVEKDNRLILDEDYVNQFNSNGKFDYPFGNNGLPKKEYLKSVEETINSSKYFTLLRDYLHKKLFDADANGWAIVSGIPLADMQADCPILPTFLASIIGTPFRMVGRLPEWQHLHVDLKAEPYRFGGIGYQPLHIDGVNTDYPPDVVALGCARNDPGGGGASLIAETKDLLAQLDVNHIAELSKSIYSEGKFYDLKHVGGEKKPFAVIEIDKKHFKVRFSGKILPSELPKNSPHRPILELVNNMLEKVSISKMLIGGEILFINQLKAFHGRMPLSEDQGKYEKSERRYFRQGFIRIAGGWK